MKLALVCPEKAGGVLYVILGDGVAEVTDETLEGVPVLAAGI